MASESSRSKADILVTLGAAQRDNQSLPVYLAFILVFAVFMGVNTFRKDIYAHSAPLYWVVDVLKFVAIPVGTLVFLAWRYRIGAARYGLARENLGGIAGLTLLAAFLLELAYQIGLSISWFLPLGAQSEAFYLNIMPSGASRIAVTIYFAATAAFVEEIVFRGLPLLYFQRAFASVPKGLYILVSSTCFSLIHWTNGPHEVVGTWLFGVAAAILYLQIRTLWPLVGAHFLIDAYHFGWS